MSSLADVPELVGFFSYSLDDDVRSGGALALLRRRICGELGKRLQRKLWLWQDEETIPSGPQRADEVRKAIAESVFFIPIVTPGALRSDDFRTEFDAFLAHERELGRGDLIFPILYIPAPELQDATRRDADDVLKTIHARQYADWTNIRMADVRSPEVGRQVARLCERIVGALREPCESPEERRLRAEIEAKRQALAALRSGEAGPSERLDGEAGNSMSAPAQPEAGAVSGWRPSPRALAAGVLGVVLMGLALGWLLMPRPAPPPAPAGASAQAPPLAPAGTPAATTPAADSLALSPERERALGPNDSFKECADCPEMVVVPAGSFTMGSPESDAGLRPAIGRDERPQHVVTIGRPFAVGRLHVTVDQFAAFVRETGYDAGAWCFDASLPHADRSWRNPGFAQEGSHPAVCLSWNNARAYVDWLVKKTGKPYRMLTEAEWEYAARGRTSPGDYPRFWFGDDENELCRYGNGADQKAWDSIKGLEGVTAAPCNDGYAYTSPAGHYEPNAFGLYDMFGNAKQWTADCWHENYKGAPDDSSAWTTGSCSVGRVVRGGSWRNGLDALRPTQRGWGSSPNQRYDQIGLRVGRTLTP
jgi:formylglycine-generating enzyme required for sulfatase activity